MDSMTRYPTEVSSLSARTRPMEIVKCPTAKFESINYPLATAIDPQICIGCSHKNVAIASKSEGKV